MPQYTTAELFASVKRKAMIPTNQATWSEARVAALANEELRGRVVPLLLSLEGEHLVTYTDTALTTATEYDLPQRAIGARLRDVQLVDSSGRALADVPPWSLDQLVQTPVCTPSYLIRGNKLVLTETREGAILRVYYQRRPNSLVDRTDSCARVTAVGGSSVTVDAVPSGWGASTSLCVIDDTPPFDELVSARSITSILGLVITMSPTSIAVGDYLALEGESPIPQVPIECFDALCEATTARVLRAMGDPRWEEAEASYLRLMGDVTNISTPRVVGEPRRIVSSNGLFDYFS